MNLDDLITFFGTAVFYLLLAQCQRVVFGGYCREAVG